MEWIIYKHTNKINNKSYIGQTVQKPEERWREGKGYKDSPKFWNAIQKYGWENFTHEILETGPNAIWADEREIYWIAYYDTFNNDEKGYNLTPGGKNYMHLLWQDAEYYEKMCKSFQEARKKSWSNEDFANKQLSCLLDGLKKAWENPTWRQERIESITGSKNPNSKAVVNIETGKIFMTIKEAAEWSGLKSVSGIGQCCKRQRNTSGKHPETNEPLHWKYLDEVLSNEEILNQTRNRRKRSVRCNEGKIFTSMMQAAEWCGLKDNGHSIKECCIGNQKTAGFSPITGERLTWSFVEEVN